MAHGKLSGPGWGSELSRASVLLFLVIFISLDDSEIRDSVMFAELPAGRLQMF